MSIDTDSRNGLHDDFATRFFFRGLVEFEASTNKTVKLSCFAEFQPHA